MPKIVIEADVAVANGGECQCGIECPTHRNEAGPCLMLPAGTVSLSDAQEEFGEHGNRRELSLCEACIVNYVSRLLV